MLAQYFQTFCFSYFFLSFMLFTRLGAHAKRWLRACALARCSEALVSLGFQIPHPFRGRLGWSHETLPFLVPTCSFCMCMLFSLTQCVNQQSCHASSIRSFNHAHTHPSACTAETLSFFYKEGRYPLTLLTSNSLLVVLFPDQTNVQYRAVPLTMFSEIKQPLPICE